jgi:hypothetical protein
MEQPEALGRDISHGQSRYNALHPIIRRRSRLMVSFHFISWVALMTRTRKVFGSNLGPNTDCRKLPWFSSVQQEKC